MKRYGVTIVETYCYHISAEAENEKEAKKKVEEYYQNAEDGYTGVATALTHESVRFKINRDKTERFARLEDLREV